MAPLCTTLWPFGLLADDGESPADIFRLRDRKGAILALEGWQDKSVDNLLASVESKREPDAARLLFGLGIRHVGEVTARDLLKNFETLPALRQAAEQARAGDEEAEVTMTADENWMK